MTDEQHNRNWREAMIESAAYLLDSAYSARDYEDKSREAEAYLSTAPTLEACGLA